MDEPKDKYIDSCTNMLYTCSFYQSGIIYVYGLVRCANNKSMHIHLPHKHTHKFKEIHSFIYIYIRISICTSCFIHMINTCHNICTTNTCTHIHAYLSTPVYNVCMCDSPNVREPSESSVAQVPRLLRLFRMPRNHVAVSASRVFVGSGQVA